MREFKSITKIEIDIAGKYRVWVDIGYNETPMFKFQEEVDENYVRDIVVDYIINRNKEIEILINEIDFKISVLQSQKSELEGQLE